MHCRSSSVKERNNTYLYWLYKNKRKESQNRIGFEPRVIKSSVLLFPLLHSFNTKPFYKCTCHPYINVTLIYGPSNKHIFGDVR